MRIPLLLLSAASLWISCRTVDQDPGEARGDSRLLPFAFSAVPPAFAETTVASVSAPTSITVAPDGRIFVLEMAGRARIIKYGLLQPSPFLTLSVNSTGERGLLGLAFDPDFANTRHVFVYYTTSSSPIHNRVSRFTASASNPDTVEVGSEHPLLDLETLGAATNHNGGALVFGPDGTLYVAVGDNAFGANAQSMTTLMGKILRLNTDGSIPADNPFHGTATGIYRSIWALGLRNPYTMAFQPGTGRLFINDVGQDSWEEINEGSPGANFGWPTLEGDGIHPTHKRPWHVYQNIGSDCAIIGASFYNPVSPVFPPEYVGSYFFGDVCGGWINRIDPATKVVTPFATRVSGLTGLTVAPDGSLYYLSYGNSQVRRITYAGTLAPTIGNPLDVTVPEGGSATFSVTASGAVPISYRWQRGTADILGATSSSYTLSPAAYGDSGASFRCIATNSHGNDTSAHARLHVTRNRAPMAVITGPDTAHLFRGGDSLAYFGTGTDPDDGILAALAFTWKIDLHHETHFHPLMPATTGAKSGKVAVPYEGEVSPEVWLRIHLTVRDKEGLTHSTYRDIQPRKASITLATVPAGMQVQLDGSPVTAPHAFSGVAGMRRSLGAASQTFGGKAYEFVSWSDGGAATHAIATPDTARAYTATFREIPPNVAPLGAIIAPDTTIRYRGGMQIAYSATGTDLEDGALPDSCFSWRVEFHHEAHQHPVVGPIAGSKSGVVTIPDTGEASIDVYFRIHLTVKDKNGLSHASFRDVKPEKVLATLTTEPTGLKLRLDGVTVTSPHAFTAVAGVKRSVMALLGQDLGDKRYQFVSWSDSGEAIHPWAPPAGGGALSATYKDETPVTSIRRNP